MKEVLSGLVGGEPVDFFFLFLLIFRYCPLQPPKGGTTAMLPVYKRSFVFYFVVVFTSCFRFLSNPK